MTEFILNVKKKPAIVSLGILILTVIIGYNFLYKASMKKCSQLRLKIQEAKNINVMLDELNILQSNMAGYLESRSDTPDPNSVMARITDIASFCKIKIETAAIGKPTTEREYTLLPCKITFSAPYYTLRLFLNKLETDKKFLRVHGLSLVPVKVAHKSHAKTDVAFSQEQTTGAISEVFKRSKQDGMWVAVNMDIAGFYAE